MPRYGQNLNQSIKQKKYKMSNESIYNLGIQLLQILEVVHDSGFTYNDLKLENILLGLGQNIPKDCREGNCFKDVTLTLADFGFASKFMNKETGEHVPMVITKYFRGNLLFSSKHHMSFNQTSQRDDLISVFFLLSFLLNKGSLAGINWRKSLV